jgi:16S rRNA U1498 N3-methylase RsmE
MDYTRILCCQDFILGEYLILTKGDSKHLSQVLRKKEGSLIQLFDGKGSSCIAEITSQEKKF